MDVLDYHADQLNDSTERLLRREIESLKLEIEKIKSNDKHSYQYSA
jgi:hypothetical protein